MVGVTTATEPFTGVVHEIDGDVTRCGMSATGWSRAITTAQLAGLVLWCELCVTPAEESAREFAALDAMIRETHPRPGDTRACPDCRRPQHYTGTEYGWAHDALVDTWHCADPHKAGALWAHMRRRMWC